MAAAAPPPAVTPRRRRRRGGVQDGVVVHIRLLCSPAALPKMFNYESNEQLLSSSLCLCRGQEVARHHEQHFLSGAVSSSGRPSQLLTDGTFESIRLSFEGLLPNFLFHPPSSCFPFLPASASPPPFFSSSSYPSIALIQYLSGGGFFADIISARWCKRGLRFHGAGVLPGHFLQQQEAAVDKYRK